MRDYLVNTFVSIMTKPGKPVHESDTPDIDSIISSIQTADVILVSGTARISYVVKILTLSPWSHVVLYVGDKSDLLSSEERQEWIDLYGESCLKHLVLDADPLRKVHLRPLADYATYMIRHLRAGALTKEHQTSVIQEALGHLGKQYDIKHILRLLLFFAIPWEILPQGFRRLATDFSLSEENTICSRVIAEAFESVGYPIRPTYVQYGQGKLSTQALKFTKGIQQRGKSAFRLLRGGKLQTAMSRLFDDRYLEIHLRGARHVTPADYDLSRFFTVLKNDKDLEIEYWRAQQSCSIEH